MSLHNLLIQLSDVRVLSETIQEESSTPERNTFVSLRLDSKIEHIY